MNKSKYPWYNDMTENASRLMRILDMNFEMSKPTLIAIVIHIMLSLDMMTIDEVGEACDYLKYFYDKYCQ